LGCNGEVLIFDKMLRFGFKNLECLTLVINFRHCEQCDEIVIKPNCFEKTQKLTKIWFYLNWIINFSLTCIQYKNIKFNLFAPIKSTSSNTISQAECTIQVSKLTSPPISSKLDLRLGSLCSLLSARGA